MYRASKPTMPSPHALGAAQMTAWGATFYAIPPLLPWIMRDHAVSATALSLAMTAGFVLSAFGSVAVGAWIQRRGARAPMTGGTVVAAAAMLVLAASPAATVALAGVAVLGATGATLLYEPAFAAVGTHTRSPIARVRAIQIITFWGGFAALWAIPATTWLAEQWGWRVALVVLAALLVAHTGPVHRRLPPASVAVRAAAACCASLPRRLVAGFALGACATGAVVIHGIVLLTDRGVDAATAATTFALMSPVQVAARLWFLRRHGALARHDGALPFALIAAGLIALLAPAGLPLAAFAILFGAGTGLLTTIRASLVATLVPAEHIAEQLGAMNLVLGLARAAAPLVGALGYAALGFDGAVLAFAGIAVAGAVLVGSVRPGGACATTELAGGVVPCAP